MLWVLIWSTSVQKQEYFLVEQSHYETTKFQLQQALLNIIFLLYYMKRKKMETEKNKKTSNTILFHVTLLFLFLTK